MRHTPSGITEMLIDLVENATLLISLCWLHGMITRYLDENTLPGKRRQL